MSAPAAVRVPGRQGSATWLDNRRDVVGSSDVPVITGSSPFRSTSIVDLWAVKTRQLDPEPPSEEDEERYWFGHALEEPIARRYALVTGRRLQRVNDQLRHPTHGWVGASLDRRCIGGDRRLVEVKWAPRGGWSGPAEDPVPAHVLDQVQWQLLVSPATAADVAVLDGDRLAVHHVEPDPGYQDDLLYIAHQKLWRFVESGDMPRVDGSEATRRALASLADRRRLVNGEHLDARRMPEVLELAQEWHRARAARKAGETAEADVKARVSALLLAAERTGADGIGWRIDWHRQADTERDVTDWRAVATDLRRIVVSGETRLTRVVFAEEGLPEDPNEAGDALVARHTKPTVVRHGPRPLNLYVKSEEEARWQ